MTVAELKAILAEYPDDMLVLTTYCSDYDDLAEPTVIEVQPRVKEIKTSSTRRRYEDKGYYERYYPNQYPAGQQPVAIKVLHFRGN